MRTANGRWPPGSVPSLVIAGSGIAGLYTAMLAAAQLPDTRITLISKGRLEQSNTWHAQGGIAAVLASGLGSEGDSPAAHSMDTQAAGAGLVDPQAADMLCAEAAVHIDALLSCGARFDLAPGDQRGLHRPALTREAAHSAARILHAGGDATGKAIASALIAAVRAEPRIIVLENTFLCEVVVADVPADDGAAERGRAAGGAVAGVQVLSNGREEFLAADAVVLATGGAGQLYAHNTNPAVATADGLAAAWRAGAVLADLEFFQFHPTSLDVPGNPLISEAVRGEGALVLDDAGNRFLQHYHPDGELAPRDVVSRSITQHLQKTAGTRVFLDARKLGGKRPGSLRQRFPSLDALIRSHGFNWEKEPVPVVPAAHYWMGGVRTDLSGRTSIPGLYAAGEVACTGVHGANRLASNSLLEGLVFAGRVVAALSARSRSEWPGVVRSGSGSVATTADACPEEWPSFAADRCTLDLPKLNGTTPDVTAPGGPEEPKPERFSRRDLQHLMSLSVGVLRDGLGLDTAAKQLSVWGAAASSGTEQAAASSSVASVSDREDANLLLTARLLVAAAQGRTESRGAHFRTDFPQATSGSRSRSYVRSSA